MKANETFLQPLLEGTKQYFVPLFQRPYSWTKKEWEVLWNDMQELLETDSQQSHFFGSIVTMPAASVPEGVTKYLLIDGQQRLTTIYVLLCLLRNLSKDLGGTQAIQIEDYFLVNKYSSDNDFYKLLPTQVDRDSFTRLLKGEECDRSPIGMAYKYFERRVGSADLARIEAIKKIIVNQLMVVSIVLDKAENPYLIFESLNAKGRPLSQADLIRNYVLMRIHVNDQERTYQTQWQPMQDLLGDALTTFIRHFLMKDGVNVRESDIYFSLKSRAEGLAPENIIQLVETLHVYANYYGCLIKPEREESKTIREGLKRLNQLEVTTGYPFLLNVYHEFVNGIVTESQFAEILDTLESFLVRRLVCNVPTNSLNKIFPPLYGQAKAAGSLVDGIRKTLAGKNCPSDAEFRARLVSARLYGPGDKIAKTKLLLSRLERSFQHREGPNIDDLTIEHILPQTLTQDWKNELGQDWANVHDLWKDTLGNLTLTGYNSTLSNEPFAVKKTHYATSNVELNQYFSPIKMWNEEAIEKRANSLSEICVRVWPDLVVRDETVVQREEDVTGRSPETLVIVGQEIPVQTWRDVGQKTLEALADLDPDKFEEIVDTFPKFVGKSAANFNSSRQLSNGYYMETRISAAWCFRYCQSITEFAGLSNEDWRIKLRKESDVVLEPAQ